MKTDKDVHLIRLEFTPKRTGFWETVGDAVLLCTAFLALFVLFVVLAD